MSNDVFISCSQLNEDFGEKLKEALQNTGLRVQFSLDNSTQDSTTLNDSQLMIVVVSSPSLRSGVIRAQIAAASQAGLPIIAAQFGNLKERPAILENAIWVDELKDQSQGNLDVVAAATHAQLEIIAAQTVVLPTAATSGGPNFEQQSISPAATDIFISCSQLNESFAEELEEALRNQNFSVKSSFDNSTDEAVNLRSSRLMIVVASSPALRSKIVQSDIEIARKIGLPIIAAQFGALKEQPESLNQAVWIDDLKDQSAANLASIAAKAKELLERTNLDAEIEEESVSSTPIEAMKGLESSVVNEQYDFFISHSSKDKEQADLLWKALERRGYNCWVAPESIRPTEKWRTAIKRGIANSQMVTLLFNTNSDQSDQVETELYFATKYEKPIASIRLQTLPKEYELEDFIWDKQWISADNAPFPSLVEDVAIELEKALKGGGIITILAPKKTGTRPVDTPLSISANEALNSAIRSKNPQKAKNIFQAITEGANDFSGVDQNGKTALHWAVSKNDLAMTKLILERAGNVDAETTKVETPLHFAAKHNAPEIANELLNYGAFIEAKDNYGNTPLNVAAEAGSLEVARVLLDWDANLSAQESLGNSPLHNAVWSDRLKMAELLIERGANLEMLNEERETPLHSADSPQVAKLLLSHGANLEALNRSKKTPLDVALNKNLTSLVQLFRTGEIVPDKEKVERLESSITCDVFVCYHSKDSHIAEELSKKLKKQKVKAWIAPDSISASEDNMSVTRRGISESNILVLIVTPNSEDSAQVMLQLQLAEELDIPMLWFGINKMKTPVLNQFHLHAQTHITYVLGDKEPHIVDDMVEVVGEFLGTSDDEDE